jgi:purine catabolism regulator
VWSEAIEELKQRRAPAMIDPSPHRMTTLAVLGLADVTRRADTAARFAALLTSIASRRFDEEHPVVICVGSAVHTWPAVVDGLTVASDALGSAAFVRPRDWFDAEDLDLDRLLWSLRDNPDLNRFAGLRLDRLVLYDRARNTQLVHTLEAFLENNGHKAETARALHLERQSLYNRIDRISELLGADLSDADARLSLHLALRVRANVHNRGTT